MIVHINYKDKVVLNLSIIHFMYNTLKTRQENDKQQHFYIEIHDLLDLEDEKDKNFRYDQ